MLRRLGQKLISIRGYFLLTLSFVSFNLLAQQVLKPQEAFPVEVAFQNNVLQVSHQIKEGYYLYRDKISYESRDSRISLDSVVLPQGIKYEDEFFGKTEIFRKDFTIYIPFSTSSSEEINNFDIQINSQGCADIGLCYPPQKWLRNVKTGSLIEASINNSVIELSDQARLGNIITETNIFLVSLIFLGLGFALAFTPCHLPTIPILSSIIIGQAGNNKLKSLGLSMSYVLGMAITYCAAGVAAAVAGQQLQALFTLPGFIMSMSILFFILGLGMLGALNIQLPNNFLNRINSRLSNQVGGNYVGVVFIGALSALLVTACVAPPLVATLMVIGQSGDILRGVIALSSLSLGLGIPLIIIGLSASKWLPTSGEYLELIKSLFGFVMFGLAIWVINPIINQNTLTTLWILLGFITIFYYLGKLRTRLMGYQLGSLIRLTLVVGLLGFYAFSPSYLSMKDRDGGEKISDQYFASVQSVNDLDQLIETAKNNQQISLLYFTADWCVSCKTLEKNTFNNEDFLKLLGQINAMKVDVTANNIDDKKLMKQFSIFGPPTIVMISKKGNEIQSSRKIGVVNPDELIQEIEKLSL